MATTYIVMKRIAQGDLKVLGQKETNGPDQAIRALSAGELGTFVAVPTRNWHEVDGAPEVIERYTLTSKEAPTAHPNQTTIEEQIGEGSDA